MIRRWNERSAVVTDQLQNKLGRAIPRREFSRSIALKIEVSGPHGLVADFEWHSGSPGMGRANIGKLDPRTGTVTEYTMPDAKADDPHTAGFRFPRHFVVHRAGWKTWSAGSTLRPEKSI